MIVSDTLDTEAVVAEVTSLVAAGCPLVRLAVPSLREAENLREIRRRLLEMGFCNGATIEVIRRAPLGDPIEYGLRGYHLSLRKSEAQTITVEL